MYIIRQALVSAKKKKKKKTRAVNPACCPDKQILSKSALFSFPFCLRMKLRALQNQVKEKYDVKFDSLVHSLVTPQPSSIVHILVWRVLVWRHRATEWASVCA